MHLGFFVAWDPSGRGGDQIDLSHHHGLARPLLDALPHSLFDGRYMAMLAPIHCVSIWTQKRTVSEAS
jgi:hypothetical protein